MATQCSNCKGSGKEYREEDAAAPIEVMPCSVCKGKGSVMSGLEAENIQLREQLAEETELAISKNEALGEARRFGETMQRKLAEAEAKVEKMARRLE